MKKIVLILSVIVVLILSACGGQPMASQSPAFTAAPATKAPAGTAPAGTAPAAQAPAATAAPTRAYPAPSAAPTQAAKAYPPAAASPAPSGASGKVVFKIVPGESKVSYEVGEVFLNQNNRFATAIGVTTVINGEIMADKTNPPASTLGPITVDISQFKSDNNTRDNAIRTRFLESAKYPIAKFVATKIEGLPAKYEDGKEYPLKITGNATVREMTLPITFDLTVKLTGDTLTGKGVTTFNMSEFKFGPISIAGVLNTEDKVKLTLEFVARP